MKRPLFLLAGVLAAATASAAQLACPRFAPATWGVGQKPLETVRVLSYPASEKLESERDYYATPPWEERERAGYIYQTWKLNDDAPAFRYEVDCVYAGTDRYASLDVEAAKKCTARWRARRDHGVVARSLSFSCR
jgi:hypothetical protein